MLKPCFSSRRRHTRWNCDWSSDVCSSDLAPALRSGGDGFDLESWLELVAHVHKSGTSTVRISAPHAIVCKKKMPVNAVKPYVFDRSIRLGLLIVLVGKVQGVVVRSAVSSGVAAMA